MNLMQKMVQGGQPVETGEQVQAKNTNWRDRIAEIKQKRQQDQVLKEQAPVDQAAEDQRKQIGQIFAPVPGLNRDKDGKIEVVPEQAQKTVSRFIPGRAA